MVLQVAIQSYMSENPIPWPNGVTEPDADFSLTSEGTEWTGDFSGYPMLNKK